MFGHKFMLMLYAFYLLYLIAKFMPKSIYISVAYMQTLEGYEECRGKWKQAIDECSTLSTQLTTAHSEISNLRSQIHSVRKLIDEEKKKRKAAEDDRDYFVSLIDIFPDTFINFFYVSKSL